jgi:adenosine deaminase
MCPHANVQIRGFSPLNGAATYPLSDYLGRGVKVTVNTDNPGISSAGLGDNLLLAGQLCPQITRKQILRVVRNGIDTAFASPLHRDRLLADVAARLPLPSG